MKNLTGEQWVQETKRLPGGSLKTRERKANALSYGTHRGMMLQGSKVQTEGKKARKCHRR